MGGRARHDPPPAGGGVHDRVADAGREGSAVVPDAVSRGRSERAAAQAGGYVAGVSRRVVPNAGRSRVHVEVVERHRRLAGGRVLIERLALEPGGVVLELVLHGSQEDLVVRPRDAVRVVVVGGRGVHRRAVVVGTDADLPAVLVVAGAAGVHRYRPRAPATGRRRSRTRRAPPTWRTGSTLRRRPPRRLIRDARAGDARAGGRSGEPRTDGRARTVQLVLGGVVVPGGLFGQERGARDPVHLGAEKIHVDGRRGRPAARHGERDVVVAGAAPAVDVYQLPVLAFTLGPAVWNENTLTPGISTAFAGIGARATDTAARNASAPAATLVRTGARTGGRWRRRRRVRYVDEGRADRLALIREERPAIREHLLIFGRLEAL